MQSDWVGDEEEFAKKLDCKQDEHLKVVSIFGNTGEGKSHTLNHTFFMGREVFQTSPAQESCTVGVWAALDPLHRVVVMDTEGLLGTSSNLGQRTRLLLKVLAVSDLVIYRTHADRLHDDLFKFLGDASDAYLKYFTKELKATTARFGLDVPLSTLGPAVIIFHETVHTTLLGSDKPSDSPERLLQERFRKLGRFPEAFSSVQYRGTRTYNPPTDFSGLLRTVEQQLSNNTMRSPRPPRVIYKALQALSERFSGEILDEHMAHSSFFPDEYFTCSSLCLSCGSGCKNSMNHVREGVCHEAKQRCRYSPQYDNRIYTCKYVIECPNCGVIYRSRQYWFGNQDPVDTVVRTEIEHIWPGSDGFLKDNNNAAQRLLDGVNFMAQSISELSVKPAKVVTSWLSDQIAPAYWRPNSEILKCHKCGCPFQDNDTKHHCRACGEGFCDNCSSKSRPVPERGWGLGPVRVCDVLISELSVKPAKVVTSWLSDQIAPAYWRPNSEILKCHKCGCPFQDNDTKHHCRACGEGFCDNCSSKSRPVPERGWGLGPVRVCDVCFEQRGARPDLQEAELEEEGGTLIARKVGEAVQNTLGAVVTAIDIPLDLQEAELEEEGGTLIARKVGEAVQNTLGAVVTAMDIPLGLVKDAARPVYWVPDHEITQCHHCCQPFSPKLSKHHCRACGQGFCAECSQERRTVPSRGWDHPVRVCLNCNQKPGDL
ncbi:UNVERIFIED_CONTAM: hypothetical protein FKN15_073057 [Acipenser sinensis]